MTLMSRLAERVSPSIPQTTRVPPLQPGDCLTRPEFERRYDATPGMKKAELIEGVVYMPPPVNVGDHGAPHFDFVGILSVYRFSTPGVRGCDNGSIRLDLDNMPQPDVFLFIERSCGGQAEIDSDDHLSGAPEMVIEIAHTSASYDLHQKLRTYRRNGVKEYLVWRTSEKALDYFILQEGDFVRHGPDSDGVTRSKVLPGLWIDPTALVANDFVTVLQKLQAGIASPEHAAFVETLKQCAAAPKTT
jgi:Uma2 family endonuclease